MLAEALRGSAAAFALNLRRPALRRAQASFGLMWAGEWAATVALGVIAFRDGGAGAVALVAAARMLPAALVAPFAAVLADRSNRERTLAGVGLARALTSGSPRPCWPAARRRAGSTCSSRSPRSPRPSTARRIPRCSRRSAGLRTSSRPPTSSAGCSTPSPRCSARWPRRSCSRPTGPRWCSPHAPRRRSSRACSPSASLTSTRTSPRAIPVGPASPRGCGRSRATATCGC